VAAVKRLPRMRSALRRLYPGRKGAFQRYRIWKTAERQAGRPGASATDVLETIEAQHRDHVSPLVLDELRRALLIDLPDPPAEERAP
jgi:hypothetical protein